MLRVFKRDHEGITDQDQSRGPEIKEEVMKKKMWDSNHFESTLDSALLQDGFGTVSTQCASMTTRLFHFTITEKSRSYLTEKVKFNSQGSGRVEMAWAEKGNKESYIDVTLLKQIDPVCSLVVITTFSAIKGVSN